MATMDDKTLFVDTNVLLAATDESRPGHEAALALLREPTVSLVVNGQVLREYLVVATRPRKVNGFGMRPGRAVQNIEQFRTRVTILEEKEPVVAELTHLVETRKLSGKRIHDANIVATMKTNGLRRLVTLNPADFAKFTELVVVSLTATSETAL